MSEPPLFLALLPLLFSLLPLLFSLLPLLFALDLTLRGTCALFVQFLPVQHIQVANVPFPAVNAVLDQCGSVPLTRLHDQRPVALVGREGKADELGGLFGGPDAATFGSIERKVCACPLSRPRLLAEGRLRSHPDERSLCGVQLTPLGVAPNGVEPLLVLGQTGNDFGLVRNAEPLGKLPAMVTIERPALLVNMNWVFDAVDADRALQLGKLFECERREELIRTAPPSAVSSSFPIVVFGAEFDFVGLLAIGVGHGSFLPDAAARSS
jgi:hypothetical protein